LRKTEYPEKTTDLPQITDKLYHTMLVVIGTDCIGSYKSNYHAITTAPLNAICIDSETCIHADNTTDKHVNASK
jgi:hypothetical protein